MKSLPKCPSCGRAEIRCDMQLIAKYAVSIDDNGDLGLSLIDEESFQYSEQEDAIWYCTSCGEEIFRGTKEMFAELAETTETS